MVVMTMEFFVYFELQNKVIGQAESIYGFYAQNPVEK